METDHVHIIAGFEPNIFVKKPSAKFTCPLCLNILNDPHQCSRGHCFCLRCAEIMIAKHSKCPVCQELLDSDKMARNIMIKEIIDEMDTFCPSYDSIDKTQQIDHCTWTGELYLREAHLLKDCRFALLPCEFCEQLVERRSLELHEIDCRSSRHEKLELIDEYSNIDNVVSTKEQLGLELQLDVLSVGQQVVPPTTSKNKSKKHKKPKNTTKIDTESEIPNIQVSFTMENEFLKMKSNRTPVHISKHCEQMVRNWTQIEPNNNQNTFSLFDKVLNCKYPGETVHHTFEFLWKDLLKLPKGGGTFYSPYVFYHQFETDCCIGIYKHNNVDSEINEFGIQGHCKTRGYGLRIAAQHYLYSCFPNVANYKEERCSYGKVIHSEQFLGKFVKDKKLRVLVTFQLML